MAKTKGVTIRTGALSIDDDPYNVPIDKWNDLISLRSSLGKTRISYDLSQLLKFIEETKQFNMYEHTTHLDLSSGATRPYKDNDDLILNGLRITKKMIQLSNELLEEIERTSNYNKILESDTIVTDKLSVTPICETCGTEFTQTRTDSRYCSSKCRQKAYRQRKSETC